MEKTIPAVLTKLVEAYENLSDQISFPPGTDVALQHSVHQVGILLADLTALIAANRLGL